MVQIVDRKRAGDVGAVKAETKSWAAELAELTSCTVACV